MTIDEYMQKQTYMINKLKDLAGDFCVAKNEEDKAKIQGKIEAYKEILSSDFHEVLQTVGVADKLNFLFSFDLSGKELDKYYGPYHSLAYKDIKNFFKDNDFKSLGDSEYISNNPIAIKEYLQIENELFNTFPWLEICAKKMVSANFNPEYNVKQRRDIQRSPEETERLRLKCSQEVTKRYKPNNIKKYNYNEFYNPSEERNIHRISLDKNKYILSNGHLGLLMPINKKVYKCFYDGSKFYIKKRDNDFVLDGIVTFNEDILKDFNYIIQNYEKLKLELLDKNIDKNEEYEIDDR